jgi:hypothetical protein
LIVRNIDFGLIVFKKGDKTFLELSSKVFLFEILFINKIAKIHYSALISPHILSKKSLGFLQIKRPSNNMKMILNTLIWGSFIKYTRFQVEH